MQNRETETKMWQNSVTMNYLTGRYFATYISLFSHICGCANNGQVYSLKDVKCVFVFVKKYGEIHGLVLCRRVQGFKRMLGYFLLSRQRSGSTKHMSYHCTTLVRGHLLVFIEICSLFVYFYYHIDLF